MPGAVGKKLISRMQGEKKKKIECKACLLKWRLVRRFYDERRRKGKMIKQFSFLYPVYFSHLKKKKREKLLPSVLKNLLFSHFSRR